MKVAYCGYDFFYPCVEELTNAGHEVLAVFSYPCDNEYDFNLRLKTFAQKQSVPFSENPISPKDLKTLVEQGCELLVAAAYPYKIPEYENIRYAVNIHPTLLPEGRGRWPLPWVILKELKKSGVTIHMITQEWDSGDILIKKDYEVTTRDNLESISAKSQITASDVFRQLLTDLSGYWERATPQGAGITWPFPTDEDRTIDWNSSPEEIDKIVRAFGKFESYATFDDKKWLIQDAVCWREQHAYTPGTVINRMDREVVVACLGGLVCLRQFKEDID